MRFRKFIQKDGFDKASDAQQAVSAAVASRLWDDHFLVRAELAQSELGVDGNEIKDDAYEFSLIYTPSPLQWPKQDALHVETGINRRQVGTFFGSPAYPGMLGDVDVSEWFLRGYGSRWQFDTGFERQDTNVNDIAILPTIRTDSQRLAITYSPQSDTVSHPGEFKQSFANISWIRSNQSQLTIPTGTTNLVDGQTEQVLVSLGQYGDLWSWNLSAATGQFNDHSSADSSNRNQTASVFFDYRPSDRFSVDFNGQLSQFELNGNGQLTESEFLSLNSTYGLVPSKLDGSLSYT